LVYPHKLGILKKRVSKMNKKQPPPKRAKATKKEISPQPRAESDTNAIRAEDRQAGNRSFVVVGVGASAGGLEALKRLLARLPADTGMAFVLVTHLDPSHESILPELLARSTQLPVSEVEDGTPVAPDHVYVMPRNTSMSIEGGALRLRPRKEGREQRRPIDSFLQSLAEDQNTRAIGVILSGTATDGTLGLEAIKAEGGITFAQDPKSAKFDSMPRSAIAAGCVDFILSAEEIANELARISRHPYVALTSAAKPDSEEIEQPAGKNGFNKILTLLRRTTGVDFSLYKTNTLHRRISRRMILNKMDGLEDYARYLRENAAEVENLYQDILINVTSFFRNPESFEVLKEKIFPRLIERNAPDEPLRIWVMGCSTGEEAYSIAMAFTEFSSERSGHIPVQIFATDINEKSIEKARAGLYSKDITADVSSERLRRFFTEADGGYRVSKPLRDMCVFARQNAVADPPFSRMDLISCRNLLIYLESALQKQILPLIHYALKPTGILWLGSSETAGAALDLFEPEDKRHRFYARKPATKLPRLGYLTGAEARKKDIAPSAVEPVGPTATSIEKEAQREADRIILARYAPASALINENMDVLQLRGDTAPYLEQSHGKAARNLLKLAREDLIVALRAAVDEARKDDNPVRKENLRVRYNRVTSYVNLEVIPLKHPLSREHHFLTLFETAETETEGRARKAEGGRRKSEEQRIKQLQQELTAARDYLQSVIEEYEAANEELQSAGEEVQSSNEELQSINEELETSKEELESSNEELTTLNEELNNRNTELGLLNSDLANVLGSVRIPILILDNQLRIRRFTPAAEKLLKLIQTDVGRPIGDLKINLDYSDLESLITEVIDTGNVKEREAQDGDGRWYSLRVRPYKTHDNKIDGAVVVFLDIDALKQTEREIREERNYAEAILRTSQAPLIVLGADLRANTANDAFYETFKVTPDETEGRLIYDLGNRQWDIPGLRQLLEDIIPRKNFFNNFEVVHEFQTIGKRIMVLNARRLDNPDGGPERILLGIDDVTERLGAAALRESEERFRMLADNAPSLIWVTSPTGAKFVNRAYLEFLGVGEEEVLGDKWAKFIHPEDREAYVNAYREATSNRIRFEAELRFRRRDGEYRWMHSVGMPRFEGGEFKGYVGSTFDIHDRKLAETAMAQMAAIVESSDDSIISTDSNGIIASWNKGAEQLFGYTAEEVIGKPVMILIPPGRADEEPYILERIKRGEQVDPYETVRRREDGSEVDISLTVSPIRDKAGKVIGASKIAHDITERKRAEARLREEAEIIETINRTGRVISAELNLQNVVKEVTDAATELVGAQFGAFFYNVIDDGGESYILYALSGAPHEAFAQFPMPRNTDLFGPTFRGEGTIRIDDVKKDPRYGKTPPYYGMPQGHLPVRSYLAVPVVSRTGEVLGGLFFGHPDEGVFTERHERIVEGLAAQAAVAIDNTRLYELSQREREKAEEASRLKDEFLATVSHELRSPLNAILGWARMLSENRLDKEKSARALEVIYRNASAQNQLIGDLLEVSRIITGKLRLEVSEVELIPIINTAIDAVRPAAEAKQIKLVSSFDPAAGLAAVDPDRLQQIVWNLLSNAVKFTPRGGQVAVRLEREVEHITIIVSDTGMGIEPVFLPFVFDRFRQQEGDTTRGHGGLGLGLAIVRHLVELHGGTVGAASPGKGRGATFTVTLPLAALREEASEVGRDRQADAGKILRDSAMAPDYLQDLRVLLVDDEQDARDLLSEMLTNYGAEVKTCASAAEALRTLDEWRPDALVSDIGMPGEDGYELLRKIRAREPERGGRIPAVALTAYARAEDARRALVTGYQMHLPKPVETDLLAAAVASLTGKVSEN
jgi:two-component system CheB/CheR fusion protein